MTGEFTGLMAAWRGGDLAARDRLVGVVYPELRAIAQRQLAGERRNHTLQATALVNEAYLRISGLDRIEWQDRAHFVAVAARLMREILVDHARRRSARKRDGGERVTLSNLDIADGAGEVDVVGLDAALSRLEAIDAVKARVVELRYFGGLTIEETATALGISPATVKRQWQAARTWLFAALADQR
ncbi:MAG TPA: sigma-70 family RNA polymerase sigma factor [Luteimonas sp.]|nr:sigma-70 family RNA polymerase sigma factor [Luteimonas sp.]